MIPRGRSPIRDWRLEFGRQMVSSVPTLFVGSGSPCVFFLFSIFSSFGEGSGSPCVFFYFSFFSSFGERGSIGVLGSNLITGYTPQCRLWWHSCVYNVIIVDCYRRGLRIQCRSRNVCTTGAAYMTLRSHSCTTRTNLADRHVMHAHSNVVVQLCTTS